MRNKRSFGELSEWFSGLGVGLQIAAAWMIGSGAHAGVVSWAGVVFVVAGTASRVFGVHLRSHK